MVKLGSATVKLLPGANTVGPNDERLLEAVPGVLAGTMSCAAPGYRVLRVSQTRY